jgi:rsbT antagonist protein RsbS
MARAIPIIRQNDILLVSIQTALSDRLLREFKHDVTHEISTHDARGLVIEVSGVDLFDSFIARSIQEIARTSRLMGVHTVLTGLSAAMAITLVEMGMMLEGVDTALNLELAFRLLEKRRTRSFDHERDELLASAGIDR